MKSAITFGGRLGLALAFFLGGGIAASEPQPGLDGLARTGVATAGRLRTAPGVSWTAASTLQSGAVISISVLRAGDRQKAVFEMQINGQRAEVLRIISRDGLWYTTDAKGSFKYRPYEMTADTPFYYICLDRSEPQFFAKEGSLATAKLGLVADGIATFRTEFPSEQARQIREMVAGVKKQMADAKKPIPPEVARQMAEVQDVAENGIPVRVDVATGQVLEFGSPQVRTRLTPLRFLDKVDEAEFAVGQKQWTDYSDDPTAGDLNDLIMMGFDGRVRGITKNYDPDGQLMNIKTGRFRRIPFRGGAVMPGCFLNDRRHVIISGLDGETGTLRPYRIDLKTGENTLLGGPELSTANTICQSISPDGKTLAAITMRPAADLLKFQVQLIDLASGTSKPLGNRMDVAFLNWTADSKHLLLLHRDTKDLVSDPVHSLALMDLDGKLKLIGPGSAPVLLADGKTILYEDRAARLWHTCDLDRGNDKLLADGMAGHDFPSPSPDGKRILWMKFTKGELPVPMIIPIGETKGTVLTTVPGLWAMPAWR